MLYHWYELCHAVVGPARAAADSYRLFFSNPLNPLSHTAVGRHAAAACEVFERTTRRYLKPEYRISETAVAGAGTRVSQKVVWERPFCRLIHFERDLPAAERVRDPKILLLAPMSGHFATLLRGTVEALLPGHEVYITDWQDARDVPFTAGRFDLDDYIEYVRDMLRFFAGDVHVFAVCQPAVPVLAAVSLMEQDHDPAVPRSMILAGGPIDTRISPTAVNDVAVERGTDWFRNHVISSVPWPHVGAGREVYPGFLQLSGFMSMNIDRHADAHKRLFMDLVRGDGEPAEKHREFYDEYLAVMDLTAEFYLQTVDTVFVRHSLPKGRMIHRGRRVDPSAIRRTALMTIEGGKDDITGRGQCHAAHDLCPRIPRARRLRHDAHEVGHYGIFNGSRFRTEIAPRIAEFVRAFDPRSEFIPLLPARAARAAPPRPAVQVFEPSLAAFTFAAANDTEPDPNVDRLRREGLGQRAALFADADGAHTAPWRLWALATGFMLGGFFRMREPETDPAARDRTA